MRVLIADDHDLLRDALSLFLEPLGIACVTVGELPKAILALKEKGPSISSSSTMTCRGCTALTASISC